jgi:hypothetical protein
MEFPYIQLSHLKFVEHKKCSFFNLKYTRCRPLDSASPPPPSYVPGTAI